MNKSEKKEYPAWMNDPSFDDVANGPGRTLTPRETRQILRKDYGLRGPHFRIAGLTPQEYIEELKSDSSPAPDKIEILKKHRKNCLRWRDKITETLKDPDPEDYESIDNLIHEIEKRLRFYGCSPSEWEQAVPARMKPSSFTQWEKIKKAASDAQIIKQSARKPTINAVTLNVALFMREIQEVVKDTCGQAITYKNLETVFSFGEGRIRKTLSNNGIKPGETRKLTPLMERSLEDLRKTLQ